MAGLDRSGAPLSGAVRASEGVSAPDANPGAVGDVDSLLRQLQSGQLGAESILSLLLLLASGALGGGGGALPGLPPQGLPPQAAPQGEASPIDEAFGLPGPQAPVASEEDQLAALLGGGGL